MKINKIKSNAKLNLALNITEKLIVELERYFQEQVAVGIDRRRIVRTWTGLFGNQKGSKRWRKSLADGVSPLTAYQNSFNF